LAGTVSRQKIKILDYFDFNLSRCSFCGLCAEVCPTKPVKALVMSEDYELGVYNRTRRSPRRRDVRRRADSPVPALIASPELARDDGSRV